MLKMKDAGGVAPGSAEGARSATGGEPGAAAEVKRWSAGRKKEVVLRLLRGEALDAVSREVSVPIYKLERWRERALAGIDAGLKERDNDPVERAARRGQAAHRRTGHGSRDPAEGKAGEAPFGRAEVLAMSRETSEGTGKSYGLERVCQVLEFPRSTIYAQQARESAKVVPLFAQRRGPKPKVSDADLLAAIRGRSGEPRLSPARVTARSGRDCASCAVSVSRVRAFCA
ncbi:MAG: hypothetical protein MZW92_71760 [Comamonadaceae bacterium]|nr:hypothetical protein [Comamonadaceae bacterium]